MLRYSLLWTVFLFFGCLSESEKEVQSSSSSLGISSQKVLSSSSESNPMSSAKSLVMDCQFDTTQTRLCTQNQRLEIPEWGLSWIPTSLQDTIFLNSVLESSEDPRAQIDLSLVQVSKIDGKFVSQNYHIYWANTAIKSYLDSYFPIGSTKEVIGGKKWLYGADTTSTAYHRYVYGYLAPDSTLLVFDYIDVNQTGLGLKKLKAMVQSIQWNER